MAKSATAAPKQPAQPDKPYPIGRTVVATRQLSVSELAAHGWGCRPGHDVVVLVLDDGSCVYPSSDPEGNEPGALFVTDADGRQSMLLWRTIDPEFTVIPGET